MRRLFFSLAVLSGLLCAAAIALWPRSYWNWTGFRYGSGSFTIREGFVAYGDDSATGEWDFYSGPPTETTPLSPNERWEHYTLSLMDRRIQASATAFEFAGFAFGVRFAGVLDGWYAKVPLWFVTLASGLACVACIRAARRRSPYGPGQCLRCGYDLRATPEKCPECGAVPSGAGAPVRNPPTAEVQSR